MRRSAGALAVLRRRPAVVTVSAEFCACQECAAAISPAGESDGWGSWAVKGILLATNETPILSQEVPSAKAMGARKMTRRGWEERRIDA